MVKIFHDENQPLSDQEQARFVKSDPPSDYSSCMKHPLEQGLPTPAVQQSQKKPLALEEGSIQQEYVGYGIIFLSSFHMSLATAVIHYNQKSFHYSSLEMVYLMCLQLFIYSSIYIMIFSSFHSIFSTCTRSDYLKLAARGFFGIGTMTSLTVALKFLPSSDVTSIFYVNPILSVILSAVLLSEKFGKSCFFSSILGFIGVLFVSMSPGSESHPHRLLGIFVAVLAAIFGAFIPVVVRALVSSTHFITSVFSLGVAGLVFCTFLGETVSMYTLLHDHSSYFVLMSLAPGMFIFIAQFFLGLAFKFCHAGTGSVMRNSEIPFIYFISILLFNQQVVPIRLFGSGLIALASVIVALGQMFHF